MSTRPNNAIYFVFALLSPSRQPLCVPPPSPPDPPAPLSTTRPAPRPLHPCPRHPRPPLPPARSLGQIEGWGEEETYFVVSDTSRVRVESLLLFDEGQLSESGASATSATKNTPKVEKQVNTKASEGKGGKGAQCQGRGVSGAARRVYRPRVAAAAGAGNAWSPDADGVAVKIFHPCVVVLAALGVLLVTFS